MQDSTKGALAATAAFSLWAVLPIFWKTLEGVPVMETTAHRVAWTLLILIIFLTVRGRLGHVAAALKKPKVLLTHTAAALCLAGNWLLYVWATLNDRILEGALGYYINPFLYILLGSLFLGEKHSRMQMIAIVIAAAGVALQFLAIKGVPWVAFGLAISFAAYGMIRKKSTMGAFTGLTLETGIMLPISIIYLTTVHQSAGAFGKDSSVSLLLIATGVATAAPLLFFARGTRSISLSLLGILQFIGPTGQLIIGWLVYHEPMPLLRLLSFALIWIAVSVYIISLRKQSSET